MICTPVLSLPNSICSLLNVVQAIPLDVVFEDEHLMVVNKVMPCFVFRNLLTNRCFTSQGKSCTNVRRFGY